MKKESTAISKWNKRLAKAIKALPDRSERCPVPKKRRPKIPKTSEGRLARAYRILAENECLGMVRDFERCQLTPPMDNPLAALFLFIAAGEYPPPELLLALREGWREYIAAGGSKSLEETLIWRPTERRGNYAAHLRREYEMLRVDLMLIRTRTEGRSQHKILEDLRPKKDADTLLREWRRWKRERMKRHGVTPDK
ncbi:MAG: hypothetical protein M0Z84_03955 [Gammaproteobacteria bacterium]|nr:hypothetical protein [Gammaproteobacteria bacterium]